MSTRQLYELVEARRAELGLSQADVGMRAFGRPDNSSIQALRRGASPSWDKIQALSRALDLELYFGTRRGPEGVIEQVTVDDVQFARIPLHEATLAAGDGRIGPEDVIDHLAFSKSWLSRIGVSPTAAVLARLDAGAAGKSMIPTLYPGDMLLIDTLRTQVTGSRGKTMKPPIYALRTETGARVKRVEKLENGLYALLSDNPEFSPEFISNVDDPAMSVIGKVVWWGHTSEV